MAAEVFEIQRRVLRKNILQTSIIPNTIQKITEVFEDHFGKENVELQLRPCKEQFLGEFDLMGTDSISEHASLQEVSHIWQKTVGQMSYSSHFWGIVVYRPKVTITNEDQDSIDIEDLYAIIPLGSNGLMASYPIYYLRTTYSRAQWNSDYLHSHTPSVDIYNVRTPKNVCIGSGPINNIISILNHNTIDERPFNYNLWRVFTTQLEQIMRVESLSGGPYMYLTDISNNGYDEITFSSSATAKYVMPTHFSGEKMLAAFINSFLTDARIHFILQDNQILIAESQIEFIDILTDYYLRWQNLVLETTHETPILFDLKPCAIKGNKLYRYTQREDKPWEEINIITFKGVTHKLLVYGDVDTENTKYYIEIQQAQALYEAITRWANFRYENQQFIDKTSVVFYGNTENIEERVLYI